jgi:NAD(P)-dependent dehydrogenase (short-subunit alcohol dehydrogenase family)
MPTVFMPTALMPVSPAVTLEARERLLADLHSDLALARPRRLDSIRGAVLPGGQLDLEGLAAAELLAALGPEFALRGLWLADSGLGPEHAETLVQLLAAQPRLLHLDLAGNRVGPGGLATMLPAIARHPGLRSLNLADTGLDISSTCLIGQALADRPIAHLRLAGAPCDSRTWAELLRRDPAWERLSLRCEPAPLIAALADNTRLRSLDLGADLPAALHTAMQVRLCANANRSRSRAPIFDLARLRGAVPPLAAPTPPLPEGIAAADLEASLRVLAVLSDRTGLLQHEHPRLEALRRAVLGLQRDDRREQRQRARSVRAIARRAAREAVQRAVIDAAAIRQRTHGVAATPAIPDRTGIHTLDPPRPCYVCKRLYTSLHFFYDRLCPDCAAESYARRLDTIDLRGKVALVTGGRIKIGHQIALRLLGWGAQVIVTSRFARDTVRRFAAHPDFASFSDRLRVYPLDLRAIPHVEAFAAHLAATAPRLDILINNAAQTIQRPPEYYAALLADEAAPAALPAALHELLPALPGPPLLAPAEHPLFPQASDDGYGQPLDLRERNSWRLRLDEVGTVELLEVQLINAVAPYVLNARLRRLLARAGGPAFIVNVSAPEGRFDRDYKAPYHPHTNMAKAALNMMTRTAAADYASDAIYMTSVDTGWASNENPAPIAAAMDARGFMPPLDLVDAATRVCDPIVRGLRDGERLRGVFLKDFRPISW